MWDDLLECKQIAFKLARRAKLAFRDVMFRTGDIGYRDAAPIPCALQNSTPHRILDNRVTEEWFRQDTQEEVAPTLLGRS